MTFAILAAGQCLRMGGCCKHLIRIGGEPVMLRQVRTLNDIGISPLIVSGFHFEEHLKALERTSYSYKLVYNSFWKRRAGISLMLAMMCSQEKETFSYMDADLWMDDGILETFLLSDVYDCMLIGNELVDVENLSAGKCSVNERGEVTYISNDGISPDNPTGEPLWVIKLKPDTKDRMFELLVNECLEYGWDETLSLHCSDIVLKAVETINSRWVEIDTIEDLQRAREVSKNA